jgi:hypothetical protein
MATEPPHVLHQLVVGDAQTVAGIVERAKTDDDVTTVVAGALFAVADRDVLMARAALLATTARDRQLTAIATAHLAGDAERVRDLARDHLVDHPDSVLVAWMTAASHHTTRTGRDLP